MSPRTDIQNQKIREGSISKILEAAFRLMAMHGYESTSISQIAKEAGVSKGLVYNYFESKEDLLRVLVENALSEGERILAEVTDTNPKKTLKNIFKWYFSELREQTEKWRLITELTLKIEKFGFVREVAMVKFSEYVEFLSELLQQVGIDNPKQEAMIISGLFDGIGIQYIASGNAYPLQEMEDFLISKYCN